MNSNNPLLQDWNGPYGLPPFAQIEAAHFAPAFAAAMAGQMAELDAIAAQTSAPTFDNTLAAFDCSGALAGRLEHLFYTLTASATISVPMPSPGKTAIFMVSLGN